MSIEPVGKLLERYHGQRNVPVSRKRPHRFRHKFKLNLLQKDLAGMSSHLGSKLRDCDVRLATLGQDCPQITRRPGVRCRLSELAVEMSLS